MNAIKVNLKKFRIKKDLTQEELAERVGVRRETIIFLEQGKYNPSLKLALSIAKELKTPIDKLFSLS
jgi:DNA-binding XRE family transcriptional regulator